MGEKIKAIWSPENELDSNENELNLDQTMIDDLIKQTKNDIDLISQRVFNGEITILESTAKMGDLTKNTLEKVADNFALILGVTKEKLPFSLFVFGATARNQMLPNSDLDIALAFANDCPPRIKLLLTDVVSALPFNDEVDIAHWEYVDDMKKENCPSMMEYNKVVEARFITGNTEIAGQRTELVNQQDTQKDKEKRFITEYGLLHKFDYQSRSLGEEMNLKYDFGASRDIVFLDWYYLLKTTGQEPPSDNPTSYACLDLLEKNGSITNEESKEIKSSLELILLTKFTLWAKNESEGDGKLLYLSDYSLNSAYETIKKLLEKNDIRDASEFIKAYHKAKSRLHIIVKKLFLEVAADNQDMISTWKLAKEKTRLDEEVLAILKDPTWNELVPFAVDSSSPEILHYIVKRFSDVEGYEYILRIISENKNSTKAIKQDLLKSRLDPRFKNKLAAYKISRH